MDLTQLNRKRDNIHHENDFYHKNDFYHIENHVDRKDLT